MIVSFRDAFGGLEGERKAERMRGLSARRSDRARPPGSCGDRCNRCRREVRLRPDVGACGL
jgi:hypothetical protein